MHAQIQIFLSERGGGGGVQAQRRENSLDFLCLFWGFLVQIFPGMRGGGGGGVQLFTGGSPSGSAHAWHLKTKE